MKVNVSIKVRFRDVDSMGHVNNAVYLNYFEEARIGFFEQLVGLEWDWKEFGILVARHEIDYRLPVELNDRVHVETWCEHIGKTSIIMMYNVHTQNGICTSGKTVLVCFDYSSKKKISVPDIWRSKLAK